MLGIGILCEDVLFLLNEWCEFGMKVILNVFCCNKIVYKFLLYKIRGVNYC